MSGRSCTPISECCVLCISLLQPKVYPLVYNVPNYYMILVKLEIVQAIYRLYIHTCVISLAVLVKDTQFHHTIYENLIFWPL